MKTEHFVSHKRNIMDTRVQNYPFHETWPVYDGSKLARKDIQGCNTRRNAENNCIMHSTKRFPVIVSAKFVLATTLVRGETNNVGSSALVRVLNY